MHDFINAAWGWNELFQREGFRTNLPGKGFKILDQNEERVGGYHLQKKSDHFWLEMILVRPEMQKKGYGALMMQDILSRAVSNDKPIRLSVLKNNPAKDFYLKYGFIIYAKDDHSCKMLWSSPSK